ncbi:CotH kinase family protein [bacterium]|nr:CotH kinase family protein [bacterium]
MIDFSQFFRICSKVMVEFMALIGCTCLVFLSGCHADVDVANLETLNLTVDTLKLDHLFPRDRVLRVDIELEPADWNTIRHQSRSIQKSLQSKRQYDMLESPYTYVEAKVVIDGLEFSRVGIRKKGFIGSLSSSRPSLKVKLNRFDEDGGIDGLSTLTFNNNQQDVSQMSQFIGYSLFNAAGSPAPRSALAKVSVNGKNLGIYSHVESVKQHLIERAFGNSDGTLFEGTLVDFYEDWEGGFERKFGKDEPGRNHLVKVIDALNGGVGDTIFGDESVGRAWVPTSDRHDGAWFKPEFDDSDWQMGQNGAGYERDQGYERFIGDGFDFEHQMYGKATSIYLRFPFQLLDLDSIKSSKKLLLRMKSDDGFIAYLNGTEVARSNAPTKPNWTSKAKKSSDDRQSIKFASYDITDHRDRLKYGRNVLAIHGLNHSKESTDLLLMVELQTSDFEFEKNIWNLIDEEGFYTFWAMEGLLSFWDGYSGNHNNFFAYLNPETEKFHFLPWGADAMFEKYSPLGVDRRSPRSVRTVGFLAYKLYQIPAVRKKYAARMKQLLEEHWDEEKLLAETHRIEALVDPHLSNDQRGWFFKRKVDFESIRNFIHHRRADIEKEISGEDMPVWNTPPKLPPLWGR